LLSDGTPIRVGPVSHFFLSRSNLSHPFRDSPLLYPNDDGPVANVIRDVEDLIDDDANMHSDSDHDVRNGAQSQYSAHAKSNQTNLVVVNTKKNKKPQLNYQANNKQDGIKMKVEIDSKLSLSSSWLAVG